MMVFLLLAKVLFDLYDLIWGFFSTDLEPHTKLHNNLLNNFLCDICTRQKLLRFLPGYCAKSLSISKENG